MDELHKAGVTAGVALNPETDILHIIDVAPYCEMILVMTVHPGFRGQEFIPKMAQKVRRVCDLVGPATRVQVDGGISAETAPIVVGCGAEILVAGSAIFGQGDRRTAIQDLRKAIASAPASFQPV